MPMRWGDYPALLAWSAAESAYLPGTIAVWAIEKEHQRFWVVMGSRHPLRSFREKKAGALTAPRSSLQGTCRVWQPLKETGRDNRAAWVCFN